MGKALLIRQSVSVPLLISYVQLEMFFEYRFSIHSVNFNLTINYISRSTAWD